MTCLVSQCNQNDQKLVTTDKQSHIVFRWIFAHHAVPCKFVQTLFTADYQTLIPSTKQLSSLSPNPLSQIVTVNAACEIRGPFKMLKHVKGVIDHQLTCWISKKISCGGCPILWVKFGIIWQAPVWTLYLSQKEFAEYIEKCVSKLVNSEHPTANMSNSPLYNITGGGAIIKITSQIWVAVLKFRHAMILNSQNFQNFGALRRIMWKKISM